MMSNYIYGFKKPIRSLLLILFFGFATGSIHAQFTLSGPTSVDQGESYSYSISNYSNISEYLFGATGGTIISVKKGKATIRWDAPSSGTVTADVEDNSFNIYQLSLTVSITAIPTPTTPTIISSDCSSTIIQRSTPPAGITWYWQGTNSSGTSTSNSSTTYSVTSTGTYYLRARNSNGTWSTNSGSIIVNRGSQVSTPAAPTITNNCGSTVLTRGSHPGGQTLYWQTSSSGTSTSNSSSTVTRTSGTVYYLRAKSNFINCWSPARTINYSVNTVPGTPSTPSITNNCGSTVLTRGSHPSGQTLYWQSSSNGTSTSNSSSTVTRTSGTVYYLRARNNSSGCWSAIRTVNYSVNTVPGTPSTPSITNNCGSTVLTRGSHPSGQTLYWQSSSSGTSTSNSSSTVTRTSGTVYYLRARNNTSGCWSAIRTVNYSINTVPGTPSTPSITNNCGSTVLTRGSHPSGQTLYWQSSSSGTSTSNSSSTVTRTSGTVYYLRARNNTSGCWGAPRTVNYSVTPSSTWYADSDGDGYGNASVSLSACSQPSNYVSNDDDYNDTTTNITNIAPQYFYLDTDADGFGDPNTSVYYSVMPSGYVSNNNDQCPDESGTYNGCDYTASTLSDENYVYTRVYQEPMSSASGINQDTDIIESVTYFDGLGRPMQSIGIKASPNKKDIITHIGYDNFGRQDKDWLPYHEATGSVGSYRGDKSLATQQYYQTHYANDFIGVTNAQDITAYSQKELEASPFSRVLKQAAPGEAWKLAGNHSIGFDYLTNTATDVKYYSVTLTPTVVNGVTTYEPVLAGGTSHYTANTLYKTITKDENYDATTSTVAHTTEEFKDKQGRVVLKRTYGTSVVNGTAQNNVAHDTYYVYDDFGNLTYVLPPKMEASTETIVNINSAMNDLGYQYKYDDRNRLVEKRIPGKGLEYIVYDNLDRPVLTQDANQRVPLTNEWLFTKYDALGRVIYTGTFDSNSTRTVLQDTFNNKTTDQNYETKVTSGTGYAGSYYTNDDFPISGIDLLTINYYDNYTFGGFTTMPSSINGQTIINYDNASGTQKLTKGLTTGSKVRVLTTSDWITTQTGYDDKGRAIYVKSVNDYLSTTDVVKNTLDFKGAVTKTETSHDKGGTSVATEDIFTYDHVGRLQKQTQELNNTNVLELIVDNSYDNLGQLSSKGVGGKTTQSRLQNVDYTYNVRGWLKQINNPTSLGTDLFGFKLNYNTVDHSGTALFNGNISETEWKTANNDNGLKWYTYTYDALNRITSATGSSSNYNLNAVAYDKNGNITSLQRRGHIVENPVASNSSHFNVMDDLTYSYNSGNKLLRVSDAIVTPSNVKGQFKDDYNYTLPDPSDDYTYDANGNLLSDANKGITSITYNHWDLPVEIKFNNSNTQKINYTYTATGGKLRKVVNENGAVTTTDYVLGYIYKNNVLQFFEHPEGYVDAVNGYKYVYNYKDHLGNVRLSYSDSNNNGSVDSSEIIDEKNYYPFGLEHQGYNTNINGVENNYLTYNGKEFDKSLNLNTFDLGARHYDPAIGRFMVIDPMTDFFNYQSPYVMADNNPIVNIDFFGLGKNRCGWICRAFNRIVFGKNNLLPSGQRIKKISRGTGWVRNNKKVKDDNTEDCNCSRPTLNISSSSIPTGGLVSLPASDLPQIATISPRPPRSSVSTEEPDAEDIIIGGKKVQANKSFDELLSFKINSLTVENTAANKKVIKDILKTLKEYPQLRLLITGNTEGGQGRLDEINRAGGSDKLKTSYKIGNLTIPTTLKRFQLERARAIRHILYKLGIDISRMDVSSGGVKPGEKGRSTTFKFLDD